jgi:hypothetical protein
MIKNSINMHQASIFYPELCSLFSPLENDLMASFALEELMYHLYSVLNKTQRTTLEICNLRR